MTPSNDQIKLPLTLRIYSTETPEQLADRAADALREIFLTQAPGKSLTYDVTVQATEIKVSSGKSAAMHLYALIVQGIIIGLLMGIGFIVLDLFRGE